jgi:hypothetical protein
MLDTNKKTFQMSSPLGNHPSLFPLRMALVAAEGGVPPRPPRVDSNEQMALQLIQKMKTEYRKPLPFTSWKDNSKPNSFRLLEVIGTNVR